MSHLWDSQQTFEYISLMKGSGGAIQSNDDRDPASNIRNITALPEIESIVINSRDGIDAGSLSVSFSTSAIDSVTGEGFNDVEGSGNIVTIDATEGSTFFHLVRTKTGNAQYCDSIVINFAE